MKILFLTYDLPYPLNSGGKIRAYYLIKHLSKKHKITLFSYYREEEQKKYIKEIKKYCQEIFLFKRQEPWRLRNFVISILKNLPFVSAVYYSKELEAKLRSKLTSEKYDLLHFESFYPALYLPLVKKVGVRTVMGNENIEWQVYEKYAFRRFFLIKWFLKLEIWRMRFYEEYLWRLADINIAPSRNDAFQIEKVTKRECFVVPNGVDLGSIKFFQKKSGSPTIIFIGTMIYQQNNDAVKYFLEEIYPKIKSKISFLRFILISWYKPEWLNKFLTDGSIEFIQDKNTPAYEFLKSADVLVAPIRIGGGTRIKILEAMAAGVPVVSTKMGVEGIDAKPGEGVIIADSTDDFIQRTVDLLGNKKIREKIGLAGRKLVEKLYDWEKIAKKLSKIYEKT
jgi:glycosyltransferase involved in cell wall biosynthesis